MFNLPILFVSVAAAGLWWTVAASAEATMSVGDAQLPYISDGEGVPVVFVHGAISDMRAWDPYRAAIANERRFVAYNQRYFGTSDWPDDSENFQRSTHIDDLIAFVEGLGAAPVHLVTWSYSGEIGIHAMLRRPDLFRSGIHYEPVLDTLVEGVPGGENATRDLFGHFSPAVTAAQEGRDEDAALRFIEAVFELDKGNAVGEADEQMWRDNGRTVPPYLAMNPPAALDCDTLSQLAIPTLVVQGEESFTRFSIMTERVASCVKNGLVLTISGVNHDGPYRKPDEFGAMIESFLALVEQR